MERKFFGLYFSTGAQEFPKFPTVVDIPQPRGEDSFSIPDIKWRTKARQNLDAMSVYLRDLVFVGLLEEGQECKSTLRGRIVDLWLAGDLERLIMKNFKANQPEKAASVRRNETIARAHSVSCSECRAKTLFKLNQLRAITESTTAPKVTPSMTHITEGDIHATVAASAEHGVSPV